MLNMQKALDHLQGLKKCFPNKVHVRMIEYAPTFGILMVERRHPRKSEIHIKLFFAYSAFGRNRPHIPISEKDSRWFGLFSREFDLAWKNAKEAPLKLVTPPIKDTQGSNTLEEPA